MQNKQLQGYYITIDQSKAFDRVEDDYLMKTLEAFGLPNDFIEYIKTLYTEVKSKIIINGELRPALSITRGVRQGCALSAPLFVLCLDPLLRKVPKFKENQKFSHDRAGDGQNSRLRRRHSTIYQTPAAYVHSNKFSSNIHKYQEPN